MLTINNFEQLLTQLGFNKQQGIFCKKFSNDVFLRVDFDKQQLIYPEDKDFTVNDRTTCNFSNPENFVVFECVHRLLNQGYKASHIELEPRWKLGHDNKSGKADIQVKDNDGKSYLIIECKTAGDEFNKSWKATGNRPTQIFSYAQQERSTKFIALYASDFIDDEVSADYYLINLQDSQSVLENSKLKNYRDANTVEEMYQVWRDTYARDYTSFGIFENNRAYHIGEQKPIASVLKKINSNDIQGKYHEFATILRQHNVSGRENAFDKLVNLFLCKVVDEKENPNELKFYWNGKAYDDPFDFQDRLQWLYKNGMEKFLGETITYIDNNQIEEAFSVFKNKPNATKERIKEFLRAQKFFTNNDFAFIEVHNEKLFYQNFDVLLKISRMIQDISLTGSEENQFLGDMFEGFLDQGVKQSEGQFFTPMPIVKFIINSLPHKTNPQVIDYACGAGHFLNEYAITNKNSNIVGIEKEYRLSKVAKVSSFMYGNDINIIYDDALKISDKIKNNSFDVLIANPPYSVKGFLETLSDEDRNSFELINTIDEKSYTANNAIECFFIERAKQLLAKDGVAGIIVPSSILNKGAKNNIYVATRELILKYFDIVAIAEFGSGTFGKTGTNTVTLFLQRRSDNPNLAEHYYNMVISWFEGDFTSNQEFADNGLLARYCNHIEVELALYKQLLQNKLSDELFKHETFAEYKAEFEKLTETKTRRSKKNYKDLEKTQQEEKETAELIKYIKSIEQDKQYYYCLAAKNATDVVIVKSPSNNNESKKFLGYEWSSAKGNEGIKYLVNNATKLEDENLDEEDKRILENLQGLKSINTPLYNPQDKADNAKINTIIANNFASNNAEIPEALTPFVSKARLVDMLDFSRVEFNKAISLSPNKKIEIVSKYPLCSIDTITDGQIESGSRPKGGVGNIDSGILSLGGEHVHPYLGIVVLDSPKYVPNSFYNNAERGKVKCNDILICKDGALTGKIALVTDKLKDLAMVNEHLFILRCHNLATQLYLFTFLYSQVGQDILKTNITGAAQGGLHSTNLKNIKIPVPPMEIQEMIVAECQKVDDEVLNAQQTIQMAKQSIEQIIKSSSGVKMKLSEACELKAGKFVSASDISTEQENGLYPCFGGNGLRGYTITYTHEGMHPLIGRQGALCGNVHLATGKFHATEHAVVVTPKIDINIIWLYHKLIAMNLNQYKTGVAQPGLSVQNINVIQIEIPDIKSQNEIATYIEKQEWQITQAQQIIDNAKAQKQAILNKYLN